MIFQIRFLCESGLSLSSMQTWIRIQVFENNAKTYVNYRKKLNKHKIEIKIFLLKHVLHD